jgi:hypothetical protein
MFGGGHRAAAMRAVLLVALMTAVILVAEMLGKMTVLAPGYESCSWEGAGFYVIHRSDDIEACARYVGGTRAPMRRGCYWRTSRPSLSM